MSEENKLTEHFTEAELRVDGAPMEVIGAARVLCHELLEPIRAKFGPLRITSGYRPPARNQAAGGKQTSFHLYLDGKAAADFQVLTPGVCLTECFDYIRLESGLGFDKVILEYLPGSLVRGAHGWELRDGSPAACIHVQLHLHQAPRRLAYVGETGSSPAYLPMAVRVRPGKAVSA